MDAFNIIQTRTKRSESRAQQQQAYSTGNYDGQEASGTTCNSGNRVLVCTLCDCVVGGKVEVVQVDPNAEDCVLCVLWNLNSTA